MTARTARAGTRWRPPSPLRLVAIAIAVFALLPIAATLTQASQPSWADARETLFRPLVGELLVNTLSMVVATTAVCAVAGTLTAWLVERTALPGRTPVARAGGGPAGDPALHLLVRLALAQPRAAGFRRAPCWW